MTTKNDDLTMTAMETLVGTKLLTKVGAPVKETKKILEGKDLVLLYFSASWCPVSSSFSFFLTCFVCPPFPLRHVTPRTFRPSLFCLGCLSICIVLVAFFSYTRVSRSRSNHTVGFYSTFSIFICYNNANTIQQQPCQAFSPLLIDFYNQTSKDGKLEIVYISSDRTVPDFEGYYKKMVT